MRNRTSMFNVLNGGRTAELLVYGPIVSYGYSTEDVTAKRFVDELNALGDVQEIIVRINSEGGNIFQGLAMIAALDRHPAHVITHVEGMALSIAFALLQAGNTRQMSANSLVMMHNAQGGDQGDLVAMRRAVMRLEKAQEQLVNYLASRTGNSKDQVSNWMNAETWFDANEAKQAGLIDSITGPVAIAAYADVANIQIPERYRGVIASASQSLGGLLMQPTNGQFPAPMAPQQPAWPPAPANQLPQAPAAIQPYANWPVQPGYAAPTNSQPQQQQMPQQMPAFQPQQPYQMPVQAPAYNVQPGFAPQPAPVAAPINVQPQPNVAYGLQPQPMQQPGFPNTSGVYQPAAPTNQLPAQPAAPSGPAASVHDLKNAFPNAPGDWIVAQLANNASIAQAAVNYAAWCEQQMLAAQQAQRPTNGLPAPQIYGPGSRPAGVPQHMLPGGVQQHHLTPSTSPSQAVNQYDNAVVFEAAVREFKKTKNPAEALTEAMNRFPAGYAQYVETKQARIATGGGANGAVNWQR